MRKGGVALVISGMAIIAGCSSGGGSLAGGGGGVSAGHGSPKAAVEGFLTALQTGNGGSSWCAYINPSDLQQCQEGAASVAITITGTFSLGNQVIQGTQALVAVTGNLCVHDEEDTTTTIDCSSNSNANAGLPPGAGSFSEAYSNASGSNGSTTAPCVEVNGSWYIDLSGSSGSAPATTTPGTSPATTTAP